MFYLFLVDERKSHSWPEFLLVDKFGQSVSTLRGVCCYFSFYHFTWNLCDCCRSLYNLESWLHAWLPQ